jgi:hypothetical protein
MEKLPTLLIRFSAIPFTHSNHELREPESSLRMGR